VVDAWKVASAGRSPVLSISRSNIANVGSGLLPAAALAEVLGCALGDFSALPVRE
jgi:hypothetical protein